MTSASQWKRCFTNPDSWTKWNIFSALFLPLELSIPTSRDTPHHICLSHRENKKNKDFPAKIVVAFWARHAQQSQTLVLPIHLTEPEPSPRTHPQGLYPYPMGILLVFGSSEGKATNPSSEAKLEVWDTRRGPTEKVKWFPCALVHPGLGSSSLWQRKFHSKLLPNAIKYLGIPWQLQLISNAAMKGPTATRKCCSILPLKKIPPLLLSHWSFTNSFCPSKIPMFYLFFVLSEGTRKF